MTVDASIATANRRQRAILRIGAVYDAGFGVPILAVPALLMNTMALPMPNIGEIWLRLDGIFLIILGIIYWIMSGDPQRYLAMVGVILLGKVTSIIFYLTYVFAFGESKTLVLFASLDAVMFALHYWALGPSGFRRIRDALQPAPVSTR